MKVDLQRDQQDLFPTDLAASQKENVSDLDVPLILNVGGVITEDGETSSWYFVEDWKDTRAETDFWVIYQVGAFQATLRGDRDPDYTSMSSEFGFTFRSLLPFGYATFVCSEALYDFVADRGDYDDVNSLRQSTSAHEAAHCFGVDEYDSSLMDKIREDLNEQLLDSPKDLGLVIRALAPVVHRNYRNTNSP